MKRKLEMPLAAAVLACAMLSSCGEKVATPTIVGINYTDQNVSGFLVNGYYAANVPAHNQGYGLICCIGIPRKWHAGMTAKVQWSDDERDPSKWREAVVIVPRYESGQAGMFAVHFYPDGSVKVLVTSLMPGHPDYPYPAPAR